MKKLVTIMIASSFLVVGLFFFTHVAHAGYFKRRQIRQQHRIYQGVKTGKINCKELQRLEREQFRIERERRRMLADGYLNWRERARLERHLDMASRHIFRAKHNRW